MNVHYIIQYNIYHQPGYGLVIQTLNCFESKNHLESRTTTNYSTLQQEYRPSSCNKKNPFSMCVTFAIQLATCFVIISNSRLISMKLIEDV